MQRHLGIQFVYEGKRQSTIEEALTLAALAALPSDLLSRLEKAATRCEIDTIAQVIADIRPHNPSLADTLTGVAEEFEYPNILTAIQESKVSPLTPQALALLPEAWYAPLQQAIEELDIITTQQVIAQIRQQNRRLADVLTELVKQYRFDLLQELFEEAEIHR